MVIIVVGWAIVSFIVLLGLCFKLLAGCCSYICCVLVGVDLVVGWLFV